MTVITINSSNQCWMCGNTVEKMTVHHGIPQLFAPKHNVLIPVCEKCHKQINTVNFGAVASHLYKAMKTFRNNEAILIQLTKILEEYRKEGKK